MEDYTLYSIYRVLFTVFTGIFSRVFTVLTE